MNKWDAAPTLPLLLVSLLEPLKKEGIFLDDREATPASHQEPPQKVIYTLREAYRQILLLADSEEDLYKAARALEKIQVAAAEAKKQSVVNHNHQAMMCSRAAQRLAMIGREYFHELKSKYNKRSHT